MKGRRRRLALLFLSGCGRIAFDPLAADGAPGDGSGGDARAACESFSAWSTPVLVPGLDTSDDDSGSQVTADGLGLYYASNKHLHAAHRSDRGSPWNSALIAELDGPIQYDPSVTADELELFFTRQTASDQCIYYSSRTSTGSPWSAPVRLDELCAEADAGGAYVTADGLTLLYTPLVSAGEGSIYVTTRPDRGVRFPAGAVIDGLPGAVAGTYGFGALSADQLHLYFEMNVGADLDVYEATRPDLVSPFSAPTIVPGLDVPTVRDEDVSITADGLELFFDSNRAPAQGQAIHVATRTCL
jgi:hypothetical protein